jgi:hypothetical protein
MRGRQVLLYFAWSRAAEIGAPLAVIDDRSPAIFELRRLFYPKFERLSDRDKIDHDGAMTPLDGALADVDSLGVISFDSFRTDQAATTAEVEAIRHFLDNPDHLIVVCPHRDIGEGTGSAGENRVERQVGIPLRESYWSATRPCSVPPPVASRIFDVSGPT